MVLLLSCLSVRTFQFRSVLVELPSHVVFLLSLHTWPILLLDLECQHTHTPASLLSMISQSLVPMVLFLLQPFRCSSCSTIRTTLKLISSQMFRVLHLFNEIRLFQTSLALDTSLGQNLFELLDTKLGQVLLFQILGLHRKLDGANLGILLVDALADLEGWHAGRKGLCHITLDGVNVVANLFFPARQSVLLAKVANGLFNEGLFARIFLCHVGANVVNDFDAYCIIVVVVVVVV